MNIRRMIDLAIGLVSCLLFLAIAPFIWLANRLWAPGPLLYRQARVGWHGCMFTIVKFRSMIVDAEKHGAVWTTVADPRITPVGRFLRKSHLDELPQCWNLLRGEMTIIGPRPERPEFVALLTQAIEGYPRRHYLKPGLTGWAQVNYGYGASVDDARIKLAYDLEYLARRSWQLDLLILWRTLGELWKGR